MNNLLSVCVAPLLAHLCKYLSLKMSFVFTVEQGCWSSIWYDALRRRKPMVDSLDVPLPVAERKSTGSSIITKLPPNSGHRRIHACTNLLPIFPTCPLRLSCSRIVMKREETRSIGSLNMVRLRVSSSVRKDRAHYKSVELSDLL
ncbi:hypothetical protein BXZ70DRAFT_310880 [Cristinia sonorae]|uniref:Uncharacterized protein n=1 Tax=Cristinia sonorae TaxID=1940300 RepID=A0A8K0XP75_9AGAR|nr:hypothetical protein BXZ70DRAFT_310880 [Cristinia sonorae]